MIVKGLGPAVVRGSRLALLLGGWCAVRAKVAVLLLAHFEVVAERVEFATERLDSRKRVRQRVGQYFIVVKEKLVLLIY